MCKASARSRQIYRDVLPDHLCGWGQSGGCSARYCRKGSVRRRLEASWSHAASKINISFHVHSFRTIRIVRNSKAPSSYLMPCILRDIPVIGQILCAGSLSGTSDAPPRIPRSVISIVIPVCASKFKSDCNITCVIRRINVCLTDHSHSAFIRHMLTPLSSGKTGFRCFLAGTQNFQSSET